MKGIKLQVENCKIKLKIKIINELHITKKNTETEIKNSQDEFNSTLDSEKQRINRSKDKMDKNPAWSMERHRLENPEV